MNSDARNTDEPPIESGRAIVDPHHHLWDFGLVPGPARFLLDEMLKTINDSGQRITRTVYVECHSMYRNDGPSELKSIGETEFANGMAAMSASGRYGDSRIAAGIVGNADLRRGEQVVPILEAQLAAGNGRLRGIRVPTAYADLHLFGRPPDPAVKGIMMESAFRAGIRMLARFDLTLDVWCVHTQLRELAELASACPDTLIILDHLGTPLLSDIDRGRNTQVIDRWRKDLGELARRPNVRLKLGGLGMKASAPIQGPPGTASSAELAAEWGPLIEEGIAAFGPQRCMFESNYPADRACRYGVLWNAFKRIAAAYSDDEKRMLFSGTAEEVYRLR